MERVICRRLFCSLAFFLVAAPYGAMAQSKPNSPSPELGWGSTWTEPANEEQREGQELMRQYVAAQKNHDLRAVLASCDRMIQRSPSSPVPYTLRAKIHADLKQWDSALTDLSRAEELGRKRNLSDLTSEVLDYRALVYSHKKDYPAAVRDLEASIKLNEKNAAAFNNFAWLRATAPDSAVRDGREGVRLARKAVALTNEASCVCTDTLAAAYAEGNDYPRAIKYEKQAIDEVEKQVKDATKAKKFRSEALARLHLFEHQQPYHADLP